MVIKKYVLCSLFACLLLLFSSCELILEDMSESDETGIIAETSGQETEAPTETNTETEPETEKATEKETGTETETETPTEATPQETIPPELRPKPDFYITYDGDELPADAIAISFTMTARKPGVSIHWAEAWNLYKIEDGNRKRVGGMSWESGFEALPKDEDSCVSFCNSLLFVDLVRSQHLPAGEYELVYMLGSKESSEFIRFTVRE